MRCESTVRALLLLTQPTTWLGWRAARTAGLVSVLAGLPVIALELGTYRGDQLAQFLVLGAASAALALGWGKAGILNLGHSVTFGVGAYASAWFGLHFSDYGSLLGILAGTAVGASLAWLVAVTALRRSRGPVTFALATFVIALAAQDLANRWTAVTGGFNGLTGVPVFHLGTTSLSLKMQSAVTVFLAVAAIVVLSVLSRRPYGAALDAIRDNVRRVAALGYDVPALKVNVFTLTGAIAGFLGSVYVVQVGFVGPDQVGVVAATNFVVWALLGSRRTIWGPVLATVAYSFGVSELQGVAVDYWVLVTGLVVIGAVLFLPDGIAVFAQRWLPIGFLRRAVRLERSPAAADRTGESLRASDITCRFGEFTAVDAVSLSLERPGIHCLIGPNGAGKTTLLDVLSGVTPASGGSWSLGERDVTGESPWALARSGLARKFQAPSVATSLTVGENLALAKWGRSHRVPRLVVQGWHAELPSAAWQILATVGLESRLAEPAVALSHGERQLLELAMIVAAGCGVLLLDEPTAGMTRAETQRVGRLLRALCADHSLRILVVEHDIAFIRDVADRITVMHQGSVIASGTLAEVEPDERVRAVYLGRAPEATQ